MSLTNGHLTGYKRLSLCMAVWMWRMSMRVCSLWLMRKLLLCMDVEVLFLYCNRQRAAPTNNNADVVSMNKETTSALLSSLFKCHVPNLTVWVLPFVNVRWAVPFCSISTFEYLASTMILPSIMMTPHWLGLSSTAQYMPTGACMLR